MSDANIKATLSLNSQSFASELDKAKQHTRAFANEVKKEVNESNHSLALMGEAFGVHIPRHIRTFVSELPGVSMAMSAAFSGLAVIVLAQALQEAYEKVKQFREALLAAREAPERISQGFEKINRPLEDSNHQLELQIAKTEFAIALLENKPPNGIKLAIAEAVVEADKLNNKLRQFTENIQKELKAQQIGFIGQVFGGKEKITQAQDIQEFFKERAEGLDTTSPNYKADLRSAISDAESRIKTELEKNATIDKSYRNLGGDPGGRFDAANTALTRLKSSLEVIRHGMDLQDELDSDNAKKQLDEKGIALAKSAADSIQERLKALFSQGTFLTSNAFGGVRRNRTLDTEALQAARMADASITREEQRKPLMSGLDLASLSANVAKNLDATKAKLALDDMSIALKAATGQLSEHQAQLANDNNAIALFKAEFDAAKTNLANLQFLGAKPEEIRRAQEDVSRANERLTVATGRRNFAAALQGAETDAMTGVRRFWQSVIEDAEDAARTIHSQMTQAQQSINGELARAMTGQKTNWSGTFQSLGTSLMGSALKTIEGSIAKALGFGGKQQHVIVDNMPVSGLTGAGTGGTSYSGFSKVLGTIAGFIPGFASGVDDYAGGMAFVGEKGPELLNLPRGSNVTSNRELRSMLNGGGGKQVNYIDARGTNAADVEWRVRVAQAEAYRQAVSTSIAAQHERRARLPNRLAYT